MKLKKENTLNEQNKILVKMEKEKIVGILQYNNNNKSLFYYKKSGNERI